MEVRIIDRDSRRVALKLDATANQAKNLKPVFREIYIDMMHVEEQVFKSKGRRGGGSWKPLLANTIRKKGMSKIFYTLGAKPGYSKLGSDTLVRSLTQEKAPFQVIKINRHDMYFGTNRPYAGVHQEGGGHGGGVRARPFLRWTMYDARRWENWIGEFLMEKFAPTK